MRRSSIDIGSNSILLLAGECHYNEHNELTSFHELLDASRITSLGKNLDRDHKFDEQSQADSLQALIEYRDLLIGLGLNPKDTIVTATEASRVASNAQDFFIEVEKLCGFKVNIINAHDEAFYTSLGVLKSHHLKNLKVEHIEGMILDIGGASSELTKASLANNVLTIHQTSSLPVGSVRATDWISDGNFETALDEIFQRRGQDGELIFPLNQFQTSTLLCSAGTMVSLAMMYLGINTFQEDPISKLSITKNDFLIFLDRKFLESKLDADNFHKHYSFLGKRLKNISGGIATARKIIEATLNEGGTVRFSTKGLRHGVIFSIDPNH